jgi:hypothetical protein
MNKIEMKKKVTAKLEILFFICFGFRVANAENKTPLHCSKYHTIKGRVGNPTTTNSMHQVMLKKSKIKFSF